MSSQKSNIWYVPHPTFIFNEDVKALARQHGLKVIDAAFDEGDGVKNPPALTLRDEGKAGESGSSKSLTAAEIKAILTEKGVAVPEGAKKADLLALLESGQD